MFIVKKVYLITKRFPYDPPMEAPLSIELEYWSKDYTGQLYLIPQRGKERGMWEIPKNITTVDLPKVWKQPIKILRIFEALCSTFFIKEVLYLIFNRKTTKLQPYQAALLTTYEVFMYKRRLSSLIGKDIHNATLIYAYWFEPISYSAALLKKKNPHIKVVTRAVSKDLYEFRSPNNYLPLKRQFSGKFDKIYTISHEGAAYLKTNFNYSPHEIRLSRQGMKIDSDYCKPSAPKHIVLLSIAVFKPLKRIDKIIRGIGLFAKQNPTIKITWHHLGGVVKEDMREQKEMLLDLAKTILKDKNIKYYFYGTRPHPEVIKFIKDRNIDAIINASETEGVPISLMEAMAHGIPAIAPNVGGIAELVKKDHGILMSKNPTPDEISKAIEQFEFYKNTEVRKRAKKFILANFNVAVNYPKLIRELIEL